MADLYNKRYREGQKSQYSFENVAISAGGRVALSRLAASLGNVHLGIFLPDYTAYEEIFEVFKGFIPIPIVLEEADEFRLSPSILKKKSWVAVLELLFYLTLPIQLGRSYMANA